MNNFPSLANCLSRAITLALLITALSPGARAQAAPIKVAKGSTGIQARILTETVGGLKVPKGSVKFNGTDVNVGAVPDWLFDRHTVLTGKLIEHHITTEAGKTSVQGLVYFLGGDWVNSFPDLKRRDNLELNDGTLLVGKVRAINADSIDFQTVTGQTRRVKNSEVKSIASPRAISFSIPASDVKVDATTGDIEGEAATGTFSALSLKDGRRMIAKKEPKTVEPKSTLAGAEGGVTKGQLTTMIVLDAVNTLAPAIVAPIVAPLGSRGAVNKLRATDIQEQIQQAGGMFVEPR